jgi:RNA 2',3'-cyclic 3'-phosphodiesterase
MADGRSLRVGDAQACARVFFALWPSPATRDQLFAWAQACRPSSGGRAVRCDDLHATLAFLGEVERSRLPELLALPDEIACPRFECVLDRIGYWRHNGVVCAGTSRPPPLLSAFAASLAQRLARSGFRTEDRPYVPHVTLLRDVRRAPAEPRIEPLCWNVDTIVLAESAQSGGRLLYRPLQRWTLPA